MTLASHQAWLVDFYQRHHWFDYSPFIRLNYLTEEVGELSRAIRALEIGRDHPGEKNEAPDQLEANLHEELGDALDQILIMCSKYDIDAEELLSQSEAKLHKRFHE
ncbi:MazG nucleotide pyrophosphohydrolase domain-containing protein [Paucilactobacillus sp. N302-9]